MTTEPQVLVVGRFPPPLDGQSIATRRLARLLESDCDLRRIDVSTGESALAESDVRLRAGRLAHYLAVRKRLRHTMTDVPGATILWPGISGSTLGHFRDLSVVAPSVPRGARVFAVVHWGNFHELFERWSTRITARRLVRRLSGVVFLNKTLRDRCAAWIPQEKQFVIPNTIEESVQLSQEELTSKRMARQRRGAFRMLYLGSMTPSKGWADAIRAVDLLRHQDIDVRLDLVGRWESDQAKAVFSDYLMQHGLNECITHHGAISDRSEIKSLFAQADVFVLPTYYSTEAQPLTIIEALNAGTPVITTRHAGIPEMIDEGVEGYFVPREDPVAIAASVQRLVSFTNWSRMSIAARQRFDSQFGPDFVRDQWIALVNV